MPAFACFNQHIHFIMAAVISTSYASFCSRAAHMIGESLLKAAIAIWEYLCVCVSV